MLLCNKKILSVWLFVFFLSFTAAAQTLPDGILSFDAQYLLSGLKNHGLGAGLKYERRIFDWFSLRGNFGHVICRAGDENGVYCISVQTAAAALFYPLNSGLEKFYLGAGIGCDFLNYAGGAVQPDKKSEAVISLTPVIGYKLYFKRVMFDLSLGYKHLLTRAVLYDTGSFTKSSIQLGCGFKIFSSQP